jgi:hypothetical protein
MRGLYLSINVVVISEFLDHAQTPLEPHVNDPVSLYRKSSAELFEDVKEAVGRDAISFGRRNRPHQAD